MDQYEALIRFHFDDKERGGKLIARISIMEQDPDQAFLQRFSDYNGYFAPYSSAIANNNYYEFNISALKEVDSENSSVLVRDGALPAWRLLEFKLEKINGSWTVTSAHKIEH